LCGDPNAPKVIDFIAGLGGRDVNIKSVCEIVQKTEEMLRAGIATTESCWVGLNQAILP